MILLQRPTKYHHGKTVDRIEVDGAADVDGIHMSEKVQIFFTDGTSVLLKTDWRGAECYLSEYKKEP